MNYFKYTLHVSFINNDDCKFNCYAYRIQDGCLVADTNGAQKMFPLHQIIEITATYINHSTATEQ